MSRPIVPLGARGPLSLQVYSALRGRITLGEYAPGERLPPEADLARAFGVSRVTVREALRLLQRDGLLKARHGRGHFVLAHGLIREPITELHSVTELLTSLGYSIETEVLAFGAEPAGEHADLLRLETDRPLTRVERLRSSGGTALIYSIDLVPTHLLGDAERPLEGSLIAELEARGVQIARARATIRAAALPRAVARRVGVLPSQPWLLLEQLHFDQDDRPVVWSLDYHRGDRFEFNVLRQRLHG